MGEKAPKSEIIHQNVRVGDRVATRITGLGGRFNWPEELDKSRRSTVMTFEEIYVYSRKSDGEEKIESFSPHGAVREFNSTHQDIRAGKVEPQLIEIVDEVAEIVVVRGKSPVGLHQGLKESEIAKRFGDGLHRFFEDVERGSDCKD